MATTNLRFPLATLPAEVGARLDEEREWEVPEGWATEVLGLPAGTIIPLRVTLTALEDGVLVQVRAEGELSGECVRCLDPVSHPWTLDAADVYYEPARAKSAPPRKEPGDESAEEQEPDPTLFIDQDTVDLEPLLRDGILAEAPLLPVCRPDCPGLCAHCGIRLADAEPGHKHEFLDPRFAALEGFFDQDNAGAANADG